MEATYGLSKSIIIRLLIVSVYAAYTMVKLIIGVCLILSISIYKTYTYIMLYILIVYAIIS